MVEKILIDVDRKFLAWKMRKVQFYKIYLNKFVIENKSSLSTPVFIFPTIPKILKTKLCILNVNM